MTRKPFTTLTNAVLLAAGAAALARIAEPLPAHERLAAALILASWCGVALAYALPRRATPPATDADATAREGETVAYVVQMRPVAPGLDLRWQDSPITWDDPDKAHAERQQWARRVAAQKEAATYEFRVMRTAQAVVPEPGEAGPLAVPGTLSADDLANPFPNLCECPDCSAAGSTAEAEAAAKVNGVALFRALAQHRNATMMLACPKEIGEGLLFVSVGPVAKLVAPLLFQALVAAKNAYHLAKASLPDDESEHAPAGPEPDHFMGNPCAN